MLDLRSSTTLTPGRVVVSQLDVVGLTQQLHVLSTSRAIAAAGASERERASFAPPGVPGEAPATERPAGHGAGPGPRRRRGSPSPQRRDVGFTISRVDRLSGAMGQTLARAPAFQQAVARPPAAPGDRAAGAVPDLFSDDATGGYRVDISRNGGPYRSLMRRHITYRIAGRAKGDVVTVEAHDEGMVDPIIPMQQYDQDGNPHLLVGEELFGIDGWSLGAPRPGPKVVAEEAGGPTVAPVDPGPAPGYPLTIQNRVEPGTLPRLRYGSTYSFQARAVDLAGNSIGLEQADHTYVTPAEVYRRHEAVPTPVVIQRRVNAAGESLMHLAVFTDGDNNILGGPSERHIAPPKAPQFLLETHGLFDEAIGPDNASRAAARKRMLDLARRESGSFLDPQVPNPNGSGTLVPAKGIAIVTNDPVKRPAVSKLPLPQGVPLRNGEYVIHDTPHVLCPYLPDVAAAGASFVGLPGGQRDDRGGLRESVLAQPAPLPPRSAGGDGGGGEPHRAHRRGGAEDAGGQRAPGGGGQGAPRLRHHPRGPGGDGAGGAQAAAARPHRPAEPLQPAPDADPGARRAPAPAGGEADPLRHPHGRQQPGPGLLLAPRAGVDAGEAAGDDPAPRGEHRPGGGQGRLG